MRSFAALVLVVACSSPARPPDPARPHAGTPAEAPAATADPAPIPTLHPRREVAEAPHGGSIVTLALSPDGHTALSADELGGIRLWPAIDGTREPVIVEMPVPKQLAVGKRADGYLAASLDEVGGLYIARLDAAGRQLSHTVAGVDPAFTGMAMTGTGLLLAWRADQTLLLLDVDGATRHRLTTEPRQRIVSIAVRGNRALAVLAREGDKRQARWLELAPRLAWGAWIELEGELPGAVDAALSPSGKRMAVLIRNERVVSAHVFDLTGKRKVIASGTFSGTNADVGFIDDDHVALGGFEGISWIDLTVAKPTVTPLAPLARGVRTQAVLATADGHAVSAANGELTISTPLLTYYLGYDTVSPRIAEVAPDGQLLIGVGENMVLLDRELRATPTAFAKTSPVVTELRWLGGEDWLVQSTTPGDSTMQIAVMNATGSHVVRKGFRDAQILQYEPTTQLATMSFGATSEVARFDRKGRSLERLASVAKASPYDQVLLVPVAPSLARGTQVVQVTMREKSVVKWIRDPRALDRPSATVTVDGPFAGADSAGNVYMWRNTPGGALELVIYTDGKPVRTLPSTGPVAVWPEPSGKRYVEVAQSTVTLYDATGTQLWVQQLATSQEALWLTDGSIAITSAGGIARLDPATGAVAAARCGWRFGLSTKPHPPTPRVEPLCSQLRR